MSVIFTPVKLDKMRNFRYSMKALSLIEKSFKKPLGKIEFDNLTIEETMILVWAGLCHEDSQLTPESLIEIIDDNNIKLDEIVSAMMSALDDAFGGGGKEENENPKTAAVE